MRPLVSKETVRNVVLTQQDIGERDSLSSPLKPIQMFSNALPTAYEEKPKISEDVMQDRRSRARVNPKLALLRLKTEQLRATV